MRFYFLPFVAFGLVANGQEAVTPAATVMRCEERAVQIEALKAEIRAIGQAARASAQEQVAVSGALAGTAVAGQVISRVAGSAGQVVSDVAVAGEKASAKATLRGGETHAASALNLSRQIATLAREQREHCSQEPPR